MGSRKRDGASVWLNEFGESISVAEIKNLTKRVRKLAPEDIDLLWHRCAFSFERESDLKALSKNYINDIRRSNRLGQRAIEALLTETRKRESTKQRSQHCWEQIITPRWSTRGHLGGYLKQAEKGAVKLRLLLLIHRRAQRHNFGFVFFKAGNLHLGLFRISAMHSN